MGVFFTFQKKFSKLHLKGEFSSEYMIECMRDMLILSYCNNLLIDKKHPSEFPNGFTARTNIVAWCKG